MTIEKICSFYWGKEKLVKITRYAETSFKAIHERYLVKRSDLARKRADKNNKVHS